MIVVLHSRTLTADVRCRVLYVGKRATLDLNGHAIRVDWWGWNRGTITNVPTIRGTVKNRGPGWVDPRIERLPQTVNREAGK